jgi:hypothetical protein
LDRNEIVRSLSPGKKISAFKMVSDAIVSKWKSGQTTNMQEGWLEWVGRGEKAH